ncbi:hypothetical protein BDZ97DRAFT_1805250, partial [Flammula alnicola]
SSLERWIKHRRSKDCNENGLTLRGNHCCRACGSPGLGIWYGRRRCRIYS